IGAEVRQPTLNTPEAIDLQRLLREMADAGNRSCVIEATSIASAQGRLDGVRFAVLVFTNLSQDHLDFHGTMEEYFAAKRRLFDGVAGPVVNVGDEWGRRLAVDLPHAVTFGLADGADVGPEALAGVELRLRGRFNVENALGAIAAARVLGVDDAVIKTGLEAVEGVPDLEVEPDRRAAIERAIAAAEEGDVVVIAGKGDEQGQEVAGVVHPFDDRVVAREALRERLGVRA